MRPKPIDKAIETKKVCFEEAYKMIVLRDHWLDGKGLTISIPKSKTGQGVKDKYAELFTAQNILLEVCQRSRDAVGKINWRFVPVRDLGTVTETEEVNGQTIEVKVPGTPNEDEQVLMQEADAALTVWWDEKKVWSKIKDAILYGLFARAAKHKTTSSVVIRLFVPSTANVEIDGVQALQASNLVDALRLIEVEVPSPLHSGVLRDENHIVQGAFLENPEAEARFLEEVYLEGGQTIIRVTRDDGEPTTSSYNLGNRLTMVELVFETLIDEMMIANQKAHNKCLTALTGNLDGMLNPERILINSGLDPKEMLEVGAGTLQSYVGIPIYDSQNRISGYTTPNFERLDPIDPQNIINTAEFFENRIVFAARQRHTKIIGDAAVSNVSRIGATNDHKAAVATIAEGVQDTVRQLLATALRWAAHILDPQADEVFEVLRPDVVVVVTATLPTPEDNADTRASFESGLLDQEEAMTRIGVEDPAAVKARILQDTAQQIKFTTTPKGAIDENNSVQ